MTFTEKSFALIFNMNIHKLFINFIPNNNDVAIINEY